MVYFAACYNSMLIRCSNVAELHHQLLSIVQTDLIQDIQVLQA